MFVFVTFNINILWHDYLLQIWNFKFKSVRPHLVLKGLPVRVFVHCKPIKWNLCIAIFKSRFLVYFVFNYNLFVYLLFVYNLFCLSIICLQFFVSLLFLYNFLFLYFLFTFLLFSTVCLQFDCLQSDCLHLFVLNLFIYQPSLMMQKVFNIFASFQNILGFSKNFFLSRFIYYF